METLTKDTKCSAFVGRRNWEEPCVRRATIIVNGEPYCKIHDPAYIKAKEERRQKERDARWATEREADEIRGLRIKVTRGLTLAELKRVTPELIRKALAQEEAK